eukprot:scaffold29351_cov52-Attheya_sp.AAC.4
MASFSMGQFISFIVPKPSFERVFSFYGAKRTVDLHSTAPLEIFPKPIDTSEMEPTASDNVQGEVLAIPSNLLHEEATKFLVASKCARLRQAITLATQNILGSCSEESKSAVARSKEMNVRNGATPVELAQEGEKEAGYCQLERRSDFSSIESDIAVSQPIIDIPTEQELRSHTPSLNDSGGMDEQMWPSADEDSICQDNDSESGLDLASTPFEDNETVEEMVVHLLRSTSGTPATLANSQRSDTSVSREYLRNDHSSAGTRIIAEDSHNTLSVTSRSCLDSNTEFSLTSRCENDDKQRRLPHTGADVPASIHIDSGFMENEVESISKTTIHQLVHGALRQIPTTHYQSHLEAVLTATHNSASPVAVKMITNNVARRIQARTFQLQLTSTAVLWRMMTIVQMESTATATASPAHLVRTQATLTALNSLNR